jgi:hypothetical protein
LRTGIFDDATKKKLHAIDHNRLCFEADTQSMAGFGASVALWVAQGFSPARWIFGGAGLQPCQVDLRWRRASVLPGGSSVAQGFSPA